MNPSQLLAIARYEALMAFRRRSIVIILILFLVSLIFFSNIARETNQASVIALPQSDGSVIYFNQMQDGIQIEIPPELIPAWIQGIDLRQWNGGAGMATTLSITIVIVSITVVMFMNESIPLDRQYRMREALDAAPITRATYLGGKVLGVWLNLLIISVIACLFSAVVFLLMFESYDIRHFMLLWLIFVLPLMLVCGALAVLLTSFTRTRRAAVMVSLLIMPFAITLVATGISSLAGVGVFIHPAYAFFILLPPDQTAVAIVADRIRAVFLLFAIALIISWTFAYGWEHLREAR